MGGKRYQGADHVGDTASGQPQHHTDAPSVASAARARPPVGGGEPRRSSRSDAAVVLGLTAVSLAGCTLFVAVYALAVRTARGQLLGNAALAGQRVVLERGTTGAEGILRSISFVSLAAGTLTLMIVALLRRRPRLALAAAATVIGSVLVAISLKSLLLDRPSLIHPSAYPLHNSFPSGHATAAAAVAAGLVLVAPSRLRGKIGVIGALYAAAVGYATVVAGWHRPSDVAGSSALVLAVAAAASAWLVWRGAVVG
jgi:membrane-associated phospholipid phosphatase